MTAVVSASPVPTPRENINNGSDGHWLEKFAISWDKMPNGMMKVLGDNKQLSSSDKNRMVKIVVEEAKKVCQNMDLNQARELARRMVRAFPGSLEDHTDDGERIGDGFYSLAKKIKVRVEYTNRENLLHQIRQASCSTTGSDVQSGASTSSV